MRTRRRFHDDAEGHVSVRRFAGASKWRKVERCLLEGARTERFDRGLPD
jgi:hypothetical protein